MVTATTPVWAPSVAHSAATGGGRSITRRAPRRAATPGRSARAEEVPERTGALDHRVHVLGQELTSLHHREGVAPNTREVVVAARVALLERRPRIAGARALRRGA